MSKATSAFIEYMKDYTENEIDLRKYLDNWSFSLGDKTSTMWGNLSILTPFSPINQIEESKSEAKNIKALTQQMQKVSITPKVASSEKHSKLFGDAKRRWFIVT